MIYDHDHDYKTDMQETDVKMLALVAGGCQLHYSKGVHLGDNCVVDAGTILRGLS